MGGIGVSATIGSGAFCSAPTGRPPLPLRGPLGRKYQKRCGKELKETTSPILSDQSIQGRLLLGGPGTVNEHVFGALIRGRS